MTLSLKLNCSFVHHMQWHVNFQGSTGGFERQVISPKQELASFVFREGVLHSDFSSNSQVWSPGPDFNIQRFLMISIG